MIRVAIIDDSATSRRSLRALFREAPDFEVVGEAGSLDEAEASLAGWRADLVSLDVFLPGGNAGAVVRRLMAVRPVPVVLVSDAPRTAAEVFEALTAGALDLVGKPKPKDLAGREDFLKLMRLLARVRVRRRVSAERNAELVVIGSSTGGPAALREFLMALARPVGIPVVVAQHLTAGFERDLARWLEASVGLEVAMAEAGPLKAGRVVLGWSGVDVRVTPGRVAVSPAESGYFHPSADVLFESAARAYGEGAVAVVLSGLGTDGALGAAQVVACGGRVFAQDKLTAVVDGMPAAVRQRGLASMVAAPEHLGRAIATRRG